MRVIEMAFHTRCEFERMFNKTLVQNGARFYAIGGEKSK
jgi:hypothetical protein